MYSKLLSSICSGIILSQHCLTNVLAASKYIFYYWRPLTLNQSIFTLDQNPYTKHSARAWGTIASARTLLLTHLNIIQYTQWVVESFFRYIYCTLYTVLCFQRWVLSYTINYIVICIAQQWLSDRCLKSIPCMVYFQNILFYSLVNCHKLAIYIVPHLSWIYKLQIH